MGKDCLEIFLNLKLTEEQRGNIANSVEALEEYFKPKTSVVYERYCFNSCVQSPDESIDAFVNRLRKAASSCKFGTLTDELILDRIVIGLQDKQTKLRLLTEKNLDLDKALNICRSSKIASIQLKSMKPDQYINSIQASDEINDNIKRVSRVRPEQKRKQTQKRSVIDVVNKVVTSKRNALRMARFVKYVQS